ncbi:MAG: DUF2029 domain-containing protein, partial [Chloroflexi bacterium]
PLGFLPYDAAYVVWAAVLLGAFAGALAWAGVSKGWGRWIAVVGALAPWWVMHAVNVGQVVPLEAAGAVIAWRLMRDRRDVLAGIALGAILFKPNNTVLVPFALLFALRFRLFASWAAVAVGVLLVIVLTVGTGGMAEYITQLRGPLPKGTDDLTLHGALGGLVIPMAIVGSLLISPYLHASDLAMLAAAGWMVWEERPALAWRIPLVAIWVLASPYLFDRALSPHLKQWPWLEIALLVVLVVGAWWPLTAGAESRRRAPA